jgi:hypothetical protein
VAANRSRNLAVSLVGIAFVVGAALTLLSVDLGDREDSALARPESAETSATGKPMNASETDATPPAVPADFQLQAAMLATLRSVEFPRDRPVRLGLILRVAAVRFEPMNARIGDENGRMLKLKATVQGDAMGSVNLEVDTDWLSPGRYLIQLTTQEMSHLPVRRYRLEVR